MIKISPKVTETQVWNHENIERQTRGRQEKAKATARSSPRNEFRLLRSPISPVKEEEQETQGRQYCVTDDNTHNTDNEQPATTTEQTQTMATASKTAPKIGIL